MDWYIESCPYFRPMSGRPPSKRARRPSMSPRCLNPVVGSSYCEDDYDDQPAQSCHHDTPRDQYQDKWDELKAIRTTTDENTRRINEIDALVRSFGAYQVSVELNLPSSLILHQ